MKPGLLMHSQVGTVRMAGKVWINRICMNDSTRKSKINPGWISAGDEQSEISLRFNHLKIFLGAPPPNLLDPAGGCAP